MVWVGSGLKDHPVPARCHGLHVPQILSKDFSKSCVETVGSPFLVPNSWQLMSCLLPAPESFKVTFAVVSQLSSTVRRDTASINSEVAPWDYFNYRAELLIQSLTITSVRIPPERI